MGMAAGLFSTLSLKTTAQKIKRTVRRMTFDFCFYYIYGTNESKYLNSLHRRYYLTSDNFKIIKDKKINNNTYVFNDSIRLKHITYCTNRYKKYRKNQGREKRNGIAKLNKMKAANDKSKRVK
jgi:hypothetical protein